MSGGSGGITVPARRWRIRSSNSARVRRAPTSSRAPADRAALAANRVAARAHHVVINLLPRRSRWGNSRRGGERGSRQFLARKSVRGLHKRLGLPRDGSPRTSPSRHSRSACPEQGRRQATDGPFAASGILWAKAWPASVPKENTRARDTSSGLSLLLRWELIKHRPPLPGFWSVLTEGRHPRPNCFERGTHTVPR